jgi:hypothetical protein
MRAGELADLVRTEIQRRGGVIDRERRNRHVILYWSIGRRKFITTVAHCGSSGSRALENAIADVRRHARETGAA